MPTLEWLRQHILDPDRRVTADLWVVDTPTGPWVVATNGKLLFGVRADVECAPMPEGIKLVQTMADASAQCTTPASVEALRAFAGPVDWPRTQVCPFCDGDPPDAECECPLCGNVHDAEDCCENPACRNGWEYYIPENRYGTVVDSPINTVLLAQLLNDVQDTEVRIGRIGTPRCLLVSGSDWWAAISEMRPENYVAEFEANTFDTVPA